MSAMFVCSGYPVGPSMVSHAPSLLEDQMLHLFYIAIVVDVWFDFFIIIIK